MKRSLTSVTLLLILLLPLSPGSASTARQDNDEEQEARSPLAIPEGYRYDPAGRRDPFVNPVPPPPVPEPTGPVIPDVRPPGLPGILLNEAQIVGVVSSTLPEMNVVVIQGPGNRTFIARPGDELLDVVISEIRSDSVVFEVKPLEGADEPVEREEVVRPVSAAPGE